MNENFDRIKHGWFPRPNACWTWWLVADMLMLLHIIRSAIRRRSH